MEQLLLLVAVALVVFVLIAAFARKGIATGLPYRKNDALFSAAERSFLGVLEMALADQYRIFAKVRVADIVKAEGKARSTVSARSTSILHCAVRTLYLWWPPLSWMTAHISRETEGNETNF